MRVLVLVVLVAVLFALVWARPEPAPGNEPPRLTYVISAHQLGIVGYRDPVGAISPDGARVAFSEGRDIRIVPVAGGAPQTLPPGVGQIRHLVWANRTRLIAEDT